jgi:hypothetical protein
MVSNAQPQLKTCSTDMPTQELTAEIITAAIEGFEVQKRRIDSQIAELRQLLNGDRTEPAAAPTSAPRKKMSAAARHRIAAAQKARWAKARGEEQSAAVTPAAPAKPKRKLSAAGRRAIVEATKKRWALKRATEKKAAGKPTKTSVSSAAAAK